MSKAIKILVSDSIGEVSAEITHPDGMKVMMTVAHGAGAGMNHSFMTTLSEELAGNGIGTLRFNFPFTEGKKGRPDVPAVAHKTIEAAIIRTAELFPGIPLYATGKSFGGRMTSQLMAKATVGNVKGLIFFGFPLHAPGKPSTERAAHLKDVKVPMLFLQGTRDELAHWALIEEVCSGLPLATLIKMEGADHSFKVKSKVIIPELVAAVKSWLPR